MTLMFGLSTGLLLLVFLALGCLIYCCSVVVLYWQSHNRHIDLSAVPNGAFMGVISTAWALSLGFVAADIWSLNARADRAISNERSAIYRLIGTAHPSVLDHATLKQAVLAYRALVVSQEWEAGNNLGPSPDVEDALLTIRSNIVALVADGMAIPLATQILHDFDALQDARNDRIAIANASVDEYKWYLVLALTVLSAASIATTHADRVRAGRKAIFIYCLTASTSLWILAIHANPYNGATQLQPALLFSSQKQHSIQSFGNRAACQPGEQAHQPHQTRSSHGALRIARRTDVRADKSSPTDQSAGSSHPDGTRLWQQVSTTAGPARMNSSLTAVPGQIKAQRQKSLPNNNPKPVQQAG